MQGTTLPLAAGLVVVAVMTPLPGHAEEGARTQMTMPEGGILVRGLLELELSDQSAFEPVSLAPDAYYGLSNDITLGVAHSAYGTTGFFGSAGGGLCVTGDDAGCAKIYDNIGFVGRYYVLDDTFSLAADGGLFTKSFDPFQLALRAGAVGAWSSDRLTVVANPSLFLGLTERDAGNEEVLLVPIAAMYAVTDDIQAGVQTGFVLPFSATGDTWQVPLSLGAQYALKPKLAVVGAFSLPAVLGGDFLPTGIDGRSLTIGVEAEL
jgi:hypothetical protein